MLWLPRDSGFAKTAERVVHRLLRRGNFRVRREVEAERGDNVRGGWVNSAQQIPLVRVARRSQMPQLLPARERLLCRVTGRGVACELDDSPGERRNADGERRGGTQQLSVYARPGASDDKVTDDLLRARAADPDSLTGLVKRMLGIAERPAEQVDAGVFDKHEVERAVRLPDRTQLRDQILTLGSRLGGKHRAEMVDHDDDAVRRDCHDDF